MLQTHQLPSAPVRSPEGALSPETCSQLPCSERAHASAPSPGDVAPKTSRSSSQSALPPSLPLTPTSPTPGHVSIEVLTGISLYQSAPPHPSQHSFLPLKGALRDEICVISVFSGLVGQGLPRAIVNTFCHLSYEVSTPKSQAPKKHRSRWVRRRGTRSQGRPLPQSRARRGSMKGTCSSPLSVAPASCAHSWVTRRQGHGQFPFWRRGTLKESEASTPPGPFFLSPRAATVMLLPLCDRKALWSLGVSAATKCAVAVGSLFAERSPPAVP